jgi:hypothetical protein
MEDRAGRKPTGGVPWVAKNFGFRISDFGFEKGTFRHSDFVIL